MHRFSTLLFTLIFLLSTFASPGGVPARAADATQSPVLPTAYISVDSSADSQANDGACTLREAILNANADDQSGSTDCAAGSGADVIVFGLTYPNTIVLGSQLPAVTGLLTLQGPGADQLTVSGNHAVRILAVNASANLEVKGLTLGYGSGANGGAISSYGSLTVADSFFVGNTSGSSSGAIYSDGGTAVVTGSAFINNSSSSAGGAIGNYGGTLEVVNSTFFDNSAAGPWGGGAIYSRAAARRAAGAPLDGDSLGDAAVSPAGPASPIAATLTVTNSSFKGNTAPDGGGAIGNGGAGETGGDATLYNNLFANNLVGGPSVNCHNEGGTLTDGGYNLEDVDSCGFSGTSLTNTDPLFVDPGSYNGATPILAVLYNSPAVDLIPSGVNGCGTTLVTDQRGVTRPLDGDGNGTAACDVGAYESDQPLGPTFVVNQASDENGVCGTSFCTLRQAIFTAQTHPASTPYTISFNLAYPNTILLGSQLPAVTGTLTIQGPGADQLTVSGNNAVRILAVNAGATLVVNGLTLANGNGGNGAAISSYGILFVEACTFLGNDSFASSGAIYNDGGSALVSSSSFINNSASSAGGAIGNYGGKLEVVNSTFFNNAAAGPWGGGAIYSRAAAKRAPGDSPDSDSLGAAAASADSPASPYAGDLMVTNSSFKGNTAPGGGGAIGNGGSGETGGTATLVNNLFANNPVGGPSVNCFNDAGTLTDGGYNIEDADTCGFSGTSLTNTDPLFVDPGSYNGTTPILAVLYNSPAVDQIPTGTNGCGTTLVTDQRGVTRPLDGDGNGTAACDAGAYESDQPLGPVFVVNQPTDEAGVCGTSFCTLRQAIFTAQTHPAGTPYTISFNLSYPNTVLLGGQLPAITGTLTLQGPGADKLTVSGNHTVRILAVNAGASLDMSGLTLANGHATNGGAITNAGSLSVTDSAFSGNSATASSGAIYNQAGTVVVSGSSFSGNTADTGGGAILNDHGTLEVVNSSFASNSAAGPWGGGAIFNWETTITVTSSSFLLNTAPGGGGAIGNGGNGVAGGDASLVNNLFANNPVGGPSVNCHNESGTLTDGGYNLEDVDSCGFSGTSIVNTDPLFVALGNFGGATPTLAVRGDSPAIDRIPSGVNGCGTTLVTDQRGVLRPLDGDGNGTAACDIGAYESDQQLGSNFVVNQITDESGLCSTSACTLRQAIFTAQTYPAGTPQTITFNLTYPATIILDISLPAITGLMTLQGPGANQLAVSGNHAIRIMSVNAGATLNLQGLTLVNGSATNGGAIRNQGILHVVDCFFAGNTSGASSGAIYNSGGIMVVTGSTFTNNSAYSAGGAIGDYGGSLEVVNSTFFNNSATGPWGGGAIYVRASARLNQSASGALLAGDSLGFEDIALDSLASPSAATLMVTASTFYSNTAGSGGGAIGNGGGGETGGTATLQNAILAFSPVGGVSLNCHNEGGTLTDGGYNLEDADSCGFTGTSFTNTNPRIVGYGFYGGTTRTLALRGDSPAIDQLPFGINGCGSTLVIDQRGVTRPLDGNGDGTAACDVGSFEYNTWLIYLPDIHKNH